MVENMKLLILLAVTAIHWDYVKASLCHSTQERSCVAGEHYQSGECTALGVCECMPGYLPDMEHKCHKMEEPTSITAVKPMFWNGEAVLGAYLVLQCNSNYSKVDKYHWYKNGKIIPDSYDQQLQWNYTQLDDTGFYQCSANLFGFESNRSMNVSLVVVSTIDQLKLKPIVAGMPNYSVEWFQFLLRCIHVPAAVGVTYGWIRDGKLIRTPDSLQEKLVVTNDRSWLDKNVQCEVDLVDDVLGVRLISPIVKSPDRFHSNIKDLNVTGRIHYKKGESISLTCSPSQNESVSLNTQYIWFGPGGQFISGANKRNLQITGSNLTGEYYCIASYQSMEQRMSKPVFVTHGISTPSVKVVSPAYWSSEVVRGGTMTFQCQMSNHEHRHLYQFLWYYDGKQVLDFYGDKWSTQVWQSTEYQCAVVYDKMTFISEAFSVNIAGGNPVLQPRVLGMPTFASENSMLKLTCGNIPVAPDLKFQWTLGGIESDKSDTNNRTYLVSSSTFDKRVSCRVILNNPRLVLVSNVVQTPSGPSLRLPDVAIEGSPRYRIGESIILNCTLGQNVAEPADIRFQWRGPDFQIIPGQTGRSLVLPNSRPEDSGQYGCGVIFPSGTSITTQFSVIVGMPIPRVKVDKPPNWSGEMLSSSYLVLSCTPAMPSISQFQWYKNGRLVPDKKESYIIISTDNFSGGDYQCDMKYFGQWTDRSDRLTLGIVTETSLLQQQLFILGLPRHPKFGSTYNLSCANVPAANINIKWLLDEKELELWGNSFKIDLTVTQDVLGKGIKCQIEILENKIPVRLQWSPTVWFPLEKASTIGIWTTTFGPPPSPDHKYNHTTFGPRPSPNYKYNLTTSLRSSPSHYHHVNTTNGPTPIRFQRPKISLIGSQGPFYEGAGVRLYCEEPSYVTGLMYRWNRDGKVVTTTNSQFLTLYSLSPKDSGYYTCARSMNGVLDESSNTVFIQVLTINYPDSHYASAARSRSIPSLLCQLFLLTVSIFAMN